MRPFVILLLLSTAAAGDWAMPGAVRRWTLAPGETKGPIGVVQVWPQSADEITAVRAHLSRRQPLRPE
jgi:hypothetical protein